MAVNSGSNYHKTGVSALTSSTRSARVNAGLSMCATMRTSRARSSSIRGAARRAARASRCAVRSSLRPRASARQSSLSPAHDFDSGLAGRVAFCAAASCWAVGSPSTTTRLLCAHWRSRVERCDHALRQSFSRPAGWSQHRAAEAVRRPPVRVARASLRDTAPSHGCGDVDVRAGNLLIALLAAQLCLYFCATCVGEPGFAWSRG